MLITIDIAVANLLPIFGRSDRVIQGIRAIARDLASPEVHPLGHERIGGAGRPDLDGSADYSYRVHGG